MREYSTRFTYIFDVDDENSIGSTVFCRFYYNSCGCRDIWCTEGHLDIQEIIVQTDEQYTLKYGAKVVSIAQEVPDDILYAKCYEEVKRQQEYHSIDAEHDDSTIADYLEGRI